MAAVTYITDESQQHKFYIISWKDGVVLCQLWQIQPSVTTDIRHQLITSSLQALLQHIPVSLGSLYLQLHSVQGHAKVVASGACEHSSILLFIEDVTEVWNKYFTIKCSHIWKVANYDQTEFIDNFISVFVVPRCSAFQNLSNGEVSYNTDAINEQYLEGSQASFTCNTGYSLFGSDSRICQSSEDWSGEMTSCIGNKFIFYIFIRHILHISNQWKYIYQ